jgi:hypothetical protein
MGASAMAFVPTRGAVIGEDAVEVVLMPTLIRQAIGAETLDYQVAPGASEASPQAAAHLDYQGHRVVWLVDGDEGGRENRAHLQSSNIPPDRILTLGGEGSRLTIEDLVKPEVFVAGVNEELRRSGGGAAATLAIGDLSPSGRWKAVETWCRRQGVKLPNKGAVAHRIADRRIEGPLLAREHVPLLQELHRQLDEIFAG